VARAANKGGSGPSNAPSRVRFIVLEAELNNDSDLTQITQAIQNALRPSANVALARPPQQARLAGPPVIDDEVIPPDAPESELEDAGEEAPRVNAHPREPRPPRKFRTPQVLTDVDLTTPVSFIEYAKERNPSSDRKKYLTVAAWFKEHRGVDAISADHAYTCFRAIKWNTQIEDFQAPLRALKRDQLVSGAGKGLFAINHLGLAEVEKND
jgi:hypothetical protein